VQGGFSCLFIAANNQYDVQIASYIAEVGGKDLAMLGKPVSVKPFIPLIHVCK
jgi:hypothetical protein